SARVSSFTRGARAFTTWARAFKRKCVSPCRSHHPAVIHDWLAVGREPTALAQIADQIPMQCGRVAPAGLRIGAPERQMDGSRDLLVEQDGSRGSIDALVGADPELAHKTCAGVGSQDLLEVGIAA